MTPPAPEIRVFLLDDHEVIRRGLAGLIGDSDDMIVVGEAGRVEQVMGRIAATSPDVAVLDHQLPDGNGVEVCREIGDRFPHVACLMLTGYADDEALFAAILAGARGYVLKEMLGAGVVDAIRRVARGEQLLDPKLVSLVLDRIRMPRVEEFDPLAALTAQERRIVELIAEGMTNRQIGVELFLSEKTIKNYVSKILVKLKLERRTEAAVLMTRLNQTRGNDAR